MSTDLLLARVHSMRYEASGVLSVELRAAEAGVEFPAFEAGSHIDLHLGADLVRSYSICNAAPGRGCYVVAVLNDPRSRGGSRYVHENLRVGQTISISSPRNNFALDLQAEKSVLLAGGIGVTPILAMARQLSALGHAFHVIYCARTELEAAFVPQLQEICGVEGITFHWDADAGGPPDLSTLLAPYETSTHFYCCGPVPMLDAFEAACQTLGHANYHLERFAGVDLNALDQSGSFELVCQRSQKVLKVPSGKSILDVLVDADMAPDHSCREGVCGACETRVIDCDVGIEHHDFILSHKERDAGKSLMICVSRCKGKRLVLDL